MKLDELDIPEASPIELLKRKLSPALHADQYEKAADTMYNVLQRKREENNGKFRHGLGYYAQQIGRSFNKVDYRALMKYFIDKYPEYNKVFGESELNELKIEIPDDEGMGIPRSRMPQIKSSDYPEFIDYLADNGADFTKETVPARSLKPVQKEFSKQGVEKQMQKRHDGKDKKPVIASSDNYIMDGHHRWLVALNTGTNVDIYRVNKPGKELLDLLLAFPKVYFKDIYNEDDLSEELTVKQSHIFKVVSNLADRKDNRPFPIKFYDGGTLEVQPSTAKRIIDFYYQANDALQTKLLKFLPTYNGFKEIAKAAGAVQESAGVGKITKQNTTPDVKPGETERQAKKFFGGNGKPKPLGVKGATPNQAFNLGLTEGYKLQLERGDDIDVLHITDTTTGKRTEVRGKPDYERVYDPTDKLHQLLDKIGKASNISDLINGEVVGINPKHPDGAIAKKAADVAYNENISVTGTARGKEAKRKKLVPGSEAWFKHWFSLPLLKREHVEMAKAELIEHVRLIRENDGKDYMHGYCHVWALKDIQKHPERKIYARVGYHYDDDSEEVDHIFTVDTETGKAYDVRGEFNSIDALLADYEYGADEVDVQEITRADIDDLCRSGELKPLDENFKDGKKPGRKGLAKRMGVDCSKPVGELRKIAKNSSGEKQRMAHWCANMKSGKKK